MSNTSKGFADATRIDLEDIPVIDLAPLINHGETEKVAGALLSAALNTGFFYIKNHGIDAKIIQRAIQASQNFFHLPAQQKQTVAVNRQQRGWLAPGMANLEGSKTHDLKEIFFMGPEKWSEKIAAQRHTIPLIADNLWPDFNPQLREYILPYYDAVCELGHKVLSALAVGLGEENDFFKKRYQSPLGRGQLVYYPKSSAEDEAQQRFGAAPHTDFGVLTLLLQDNNGGLQVLNKQDQWIEAPPINNTFVCNIGDLLHRWTNDYLCSNLHRVINRSGNERFSMPIFFDPDPDVEIDYKDFKMLADQPRKHEIVRVAEYIDAKNRKAFTQYSQDE